MKVRAGSRPPISSTTIWIVGSSSTRAASPTIGSVPRSRPSRGRVRSASAMAARLSRAPARSSSIWWRVWRIFTTPAPTVPSPSRPMRTSFTPLTAGRVSAAQVPEAAQRLPDTLLVFHQREAHVALAVLAEADAGRHRHLGLLDEELGELQRAEAAERLGNRRPHEHGGPRLGHAPAELVEPIDQHVAALAMHLDDLADALLVAFQRHDAGDLDRLERPVVEVRLDPGQRADHLRVAAHEAQAPAGHVVGLRGREDLDADLLGARHLQERRGTVVIEREVGVREVEDDHQPMLAGEVDELDEEVAF